MRYEVKSITEDWRYYKYFSVRKDAKWSTVRKRALALAREDAIEVIILQDNGYRLETITIKK